MRRLLDEVPPLEAALAQRFLPAIVERVAGDKQARGLFDFQDMLRVVHEVLSGPRGDELTDRIRRRHP